MSKRKKEDIVKRLQRLGDRELCDMTRDLRGVIPRALYDAADEIERLRIELELARKARAQP